MNDLMFVLIVIKISLDNMIGRDIWNYMIQARSSNAPDTLQMEDLGVATRNLRGKML
jgi:hypothetical protein